MPKKNREKTTTVREHPRHVSVSKKNPTGVTIVDEHPRRLSGTYLDAVEITKIAENYDRKDLIFPTAGKLKEYPNADSYDDLIAIWTDYFNKKFGEVPKLDPDVIKALIASESDFQLAPKNPLAIEIAQVTPATLAILQDPFGETKEFIFGKIRQKDLKNPEIAIPMAVRWLLRKRFLAETKLKRPPTDEEVILEYKGLLRSTSIFKTKALKKFRKHYAALKKTK